MSWPHCEKDHDVTAANNFLHGNLECTIKHPDMLIGTEIIRFKQKEKYFEITFFLASHRSVESFLPGKLRIRVCNLCMKLLSKACIRDTYQQ